MSYWTAALEESRRKRNEMTKGDVEAWKWVPEGYLPHFCSVREQLKRFLDLLSNNGERNEIKKDEKAAIVKDTRFALRFGISCLSMPSDEARSTAQEEVIRTGWHEEVIRIVCHSRGDSKCRLYAAQALSNLVTMNSQSARVVRSRMMLSPSNESISATILNEALAQQTKDASEAHQESKPENKPNWVDAMLSASKSGNREALAAVVAALHNCLLSHSTISEQNEYAQQISSSSLLISTILRQLVSTNAIVNNKKTADMDKQQEQQKHPADDATEWIVIFLMQLCRQGFLPAMYQAVGTSSLICVLPEQVALLHCLRNEVESGDNNKNLGRCALLGGEYPDTAGDRSIASYLFLTRVACSLLSIEEQETTDSVEYEEALRQSAVLTILEILAETLAEESATTASIRHKLGETELIQLLCEELGQLYDKLLLRNNGRKSRDILVKDDEQAKLTVLVRLLGNLAFACPFNQDLLRTTRISPERSGLHILLSCTSFAHACFTLREWAVVAIRNVLHENIANQQVVAELEAQQAVQSEELRDMGIRVELDCSKGQVSVTPLGEQSRGDGQKDPRAKE